MELKYDSELGYERFYFTDHSPLDDALEYHLYKMADGSWQIHNERTGEIVCINNARVREWLNRRISG